MYHLVVKNIGRSQSCYVNSAIEGAAYRAGESLVDHSSGEIYDYREKVVYHSEIINSNDKAFWASQRESLWNSVECANTRKNACFAKEIELALPVGLSHQAKIKLARKFVTNEIVEKYGVVADIGFHNFEGAGSNNPHCHIMYTIRSVQDKGFGTRVSNLVRRKFVFDIRKKWADYANPVLINAGFSRIDERSCIRQGTERRSVPMGARAWNMYERGKKTAPGDEHTRAKQGLKTLRQIEWEKTRERDLERDYR